EPAKADIDDEPAAVCFDHVGVDDLAALREGAHPYPLTAVARPAEREHRPSVWPFRLDDGGHDAHPRLDIDTLGGSLTCGQHACRASFEIDQDFVARDRSDDPLHELPRMKR